MFQTKKLNNQVTINFVLVNNHIENGSIEQQHILQMWKGSVSSVIETAAEKGQLNDWLMALVPVGRLHVNM